MNIESHVSLLTRSGLADEYEFIGSAAFRRVYVVGILGSRQNLVLLCAPGSLPFKISFFAHGSAMAGVASVALAARNEGKL